MDTPLKHYNNAIFLLDQAFGEVEDAKLSFREHGIPLGDLRKVSEKLDRFRDRINRLACDMERSRVRNLL